MKVVSILLIIVAMAATSCRKEYNVRYKVSCASCSLTYSDSGDNTQQHPADGDWSLDFEGEPGQFLYLSAQNELASGSVSVSITVNGDQVDSATSTGGYVVATASGSVPE